MSESPTLEFRKVTKFFTPEKLIVNELSFQIKKGEFFSILGPSGCGKTTCLRMISGLDRPNSGEVFLDGKCVNEVHPHHRNVHMVFQKYALFPHLNVFDNIAFGLRIKKISEKIIKDRVLRMLKMVNLPDYSRRKINELSGGEQQRIALTRSLVNEPSILLLDEPLGALDLKLREQMQLELVAIQKKSGITFIFVTHDQWEALTLSDRIAIMNRGKIEQLGPPNEVYEHPSTSFAAKFVGTTNIILTKAVSKNSDFFELNGRDNFTGNFKAPLRNHLTSETLLNLVVRPEKIKFSKTKPQQSFNVLEGKVLDKTYFGASTQVRLQLNENCPPLIILQANQNSTTQDELKIDEKIFAHWNTEDCVAVKHE